nr:zinc finger A20 and AN1 domain-containing stress-associated protein 8-like [Ipomoea batatas]
MSGVLCENGAVSVSSYSKRETIRAETRNLITRLQIGTSESKNSVLDSFLLLLQKLQRHGAERSWHPTPVLCVNNCGFFGTVATMNMCSKCYKDTVLKQEQARLAASSIESIMNGSGKSVDVVVVSSHDGSAESSAVTAQDSRLSHTTREQWRSIIRRQLRIPYPKPTWLLRLKSSTKSREGDEREAEEEFHLCYKFVKPTPPIAKNGYSGTMSAQENAEEQKRRISSRLEFLKKEKQEFSGATDFVDKLRTGTLSYSTGNNP